MHDVLPQWSSSVAVLAAYVAVSGVQLKYVRAELSQAAARRAADAGLAGLAADASRISLPSGRLKEAALIQAGLVTAMLAIIPPLGDWSREYLWVRACQALVLCFAAPMLIVAGLHRHPAESARWPSSPWSRMVPVVAAVAFNVCFLGSQVPAVFDLVTGSTLARAVEQGLFLGIGVWFWLQIFRPQPGPWQPPLRRLVLVTATTVASTVLGMALVFGWGVVYTGYANSQHHVMTVLDDQQLAGAVLWMGVLPFLVTAGVILLNAWLNDEDADRPADPEVLKRRAMRTWAARSGLR
jgi:cytochrome c oxidase assembly factor CtaG